jgi:hypothetical protein
MSENVFDIQRRIAEVFKIHGQPVPQPQFDEGATEYRQRLLCVAKNLLPDDHVWRGQDIRRQPERAFDSIEKALVHDRVREFKQPTGPLRSMLTGDGLFERQTVRYFGDPENCWGRFAGPTIRRVTGVTDEGHGAKSVAYRAAVAAYEREVGLGLQALAAQRAAAGSVSA